jgi:hypothetical protein
MENEHDPGTGAVPGKKINHDEAMARTSMIFCMIAAFYIAVIPESIFSAIAWSLYVIGAITGIIHLRRVKDKHTMMMYVFWLILDVYAIIRLLIII